jgi:hypothetical protein
LWTTQTGELVTGGYVVDGHRNMRHEKNDQFRVLDWRRWHPAIAQFASTHLSRFAKN